MWKDKKPTMGIDAEFCPEPVSELIVRKERDGRMRKPRSRQIRSDSVLMLDD